MSSDPNPLSQSKGYTLSSRVSSLTLLPCSTLSVREMKDSSESPAEQQPPKRWRDELLAPVTPTSKPCRGAEEPPRRALLHTGLQNPRDGLGRVGHHCQNLLSHSSHHAHSWTVLYSIIWCTKANMGTECKLMAWDGNDVIWVFLGFFAVARRFLLQWFSQELRAFAE